MSVPFCNTHLRIPRGFGTLLEGLAREVLRDQPKDIPKYAAQYFSALLKQKEDSGMDPAEWEAKLEDMYHNNAFKAPGAIPEKYPATEVMMSNEQSKDHLTEDESSYSGETFDLSTTQGTSREELDLTASTEGYEEKDDIMEKHVFLPEKGISEEETVIVLPAGDCLNRTEEKDPTTNTFDHVDRAAVASDQDMPQSELLPTDVSSFRAIMNMDVCAQDLRMAEDDGGDQQETGVVNEEIINSEGLTYTDSEAKVEVLPHAGQADVDVCATELGATERTIEGDNAEYDEDSSNPQPEDTVEQSSFETPDRNQHEFKGQVEKENAEETETETSPGEITEGSAHRKGPLINNAEPKEDSLVEISLDDVPEDPQINDEFEDKQQDEEVSQDNVLETHLEDESKEVTLLSTDKHISGTQDQDEIEMTGVKKVINSEGGHMKSQQEEFHMMKERVDTNYSNLNDSDDEKLKRVRTGSSHRPTTKAGEENPEDETDQNEHNEKIMKGKFHQNEDMEEDAESSNPYYKEDETAGIVGGDNGDINTEGYDEVEDHLFGVTGSNVSTAATEVETLEASAQHLLEEDEEGQRTPAEPQPENAVVENEVTSKEISSKERDLVEEGNIDSEIEKKNNAMCDEGSSIIPTESADWPAASHQGEEQTLETIGDKVTFYAFFSMRNTCTVAAHHISSTRIRRQRVTVHTILYCFPSCLR
ncbi:RE1-silencing transcription factor [Pungitius pungitius]|uniref:RE1-silencing transcription factor n=1 Tax=Pungitius pungitius TaxID=134920 RepID=UPI002E1293C6